MTSAMNPGGGPSVQTLTSQDCKYLTGINSIELVGVTEPWKRTAALETWTQRAVVEMSVISREFSDFARKIFRYCKDVHTKVQQGHTPPAYVVRDEHLEYGAKLALILLKSAPDRVANQCYRAMGASEHALCACDVMERIYDFVSPGGSHEIVSYITDHIRNQDKENSDIMHGLA